ncbi:MAG: hypothetical protein ACXWL2_01150 [Candidatus Chromulinivorax sp.]
MYISLLSFYQVTGSYLNDPRYNDDIKKDRWVQKTESFKDDHKMVTIIFEDQSFDIFTVGLLKRETKIINEDKYSYTEETTHFFVDGTSHRLSEIKYDKINNNIVSSSIHLIKGPRIRALGVPPLFPPSENDIDLNQTQEMPQQNRNRYRRTITQNSCCTIN